MKRINQTGLVLDMLSYVVWGVLPIFWALLAEVNSVYILSQRILWSLLMAAVLLAFLKKTDEIKRVFRSRHDFLICFACGVLITLCWGLYIYAVNSGYVLEASMGYFVQPVMVALVGFAVFRERPSRAEWTTFGFAVIGIGFLVIRTGTFPTLGLAMAGAFVVYGALKKNLNVSPYTSLFMETLCMAPFCAAFSLWWERRSGGLAGALNGAPFWLLIAAGFVTLLPMLLFNIGVQKIPYYVNGILMYINPTLQFLAGLLCLHAELERDRLIAFVIIWVGILFTIGEKWKLLSEARRPASPVSADEGAGRG